jgi:predicted Holliday junction resolvase-like endonuclease
MILIIALILGWVVAVSLAILCLLLLVVVGAQQAQILEGLKEINFLKGKLDLENSQSRANLHKSAEMLRSEIAKDYLRNFEKWNIKKFRD